MKYLFLICLFIISLQSCFEEEAMVPAHEQGDLEVGQAGLGSDYGAQIYYDLYDNEEVTSNVISKWDLSFESSTGGWTIRLNSSKFMLAGNSYDTLFSADLKPVNLEMKFDKSDGNPDSTALGQWYVSTEDSAWSNKYVYLVDRGKNEANRPVGFKKVQFEISDNDFLMRYANSDNRRDTMVTISRDPVMDKIYFSFDQGEVDIAPLPDQWSLLFTKYTTMLQTDEGENYPYLVTGVLLNPNGVVALRDTIHDFMDIALDSIIGFGFTTQSDVIGYDWKDYNFDAGVYTIVPDMNYVIRDKDGFFYKLRFVDFNNDLGEKGYPKFEFARL